jgi:hypothetical protein
MDRRAIPGGVSFTFTYRDDGGIAIRIDIEAVLARLLNCEREIWCIDLVGFAAIQLANAKVNDTLVHLDLNNVVANVRESDTGLVIHPQHAATDIQLRA